MSLLTTTFLPNSDGEQADLSRLTNGMNALVEFNEQCWRGKNNCDLCDGVRDGLSRAAVRMQTHSDLVEQRVCISFVCIGRYDSYLSADQCSPQLYT